VKSRRPAWFIAGLCILGASASRSAPADRGVAVVELFTSEGCSSCPPADALLERIVTDAAKSGRRVYCLAFHVDYWDHLGWKDRFGSAQFTRRQDAYVRRLGASSLYTPQMVINGSDEFVGSDKNAAESAIRDALSRAETATIQVTATAKNGDVSAHCKVAHAPKGAVLQVAWVDAHAVSAPDRGENDGRTLHHTNVVRDLRAVTLASTYDGNVTLKRPEVAEGAVIAWVQSGNAGPVLAAQSVRIPAH
jgi:hypothetical protein